MAYYIVVWGPDPANPYKDFAEVSDDGSLQVKCPTPQLFPSVEVARLTAMLRGYRVYCVHAEGAFRDCAYVAPPERPEI